MVSKKKHGEYFLLSWGEAPACYHAAKGHLSPEEFTDLLERELGEEGWGVNPGKEDLVNYGPSRHLYARYGWMDCYGWGWPEGEPAQTLYFFEGKERGCFPVTVIFRTNT